MTGCQRSRFDLIALRRHRIRRRQPVGSSPSIPSTSSATASTSCALAPRRRTRPRRRFSMRYERFVAESSRNASRPGSRRSPRTSVTPSGGRWIVEVRSRPRWISTRSRSPQTGDDEEELLLGFREALASMPEKQRQALVLREWQGVPSREIASELGLSATATHALLTRARHSFAQALTVPATPGRRPGLAGCSSSDLTSRRSSAGFRRRRPSRRSRSSRSGLGAGGVVVDRSLADSTGSVGSGARHRPVGDRVERDRAGRTARRIPFGRRVARAAGSRASSRDALSTPADPGRRPSRRRAAACGTTGEDGSRAGRGRSPVRMRNRPRPRRDTRSTLPIDAAAAARWSSFRRCAAAAPSQCPRSTAGRRAPATSASAVAERSSTGSGTFRCPSRAVAATGRCGKLAR